MLTGTNIVGLLPGKEDRSCPLPIADGRWPVLAFAWKGRLCRAVRPLGRHSRPYAKPVKVKVIVVQPLRSMALQRTT